MRTRHTRIQSLHEKKRDSDPRTDANAVCPRQLPKPPTHPHHAPKRRSHDAPKTRSHYAPEAVWAWEVPNARAQADTIHHRWQKTWTLSGSVLEALDGVLRDCGWVYEVRTHVWCCFRTTWHAGPIFGNRDDNQPVVVHGRKLRGAHSHSWFDPHVSTELQNFLHRNFSTSSLSVCVCLSVCLFSSIAQCFARNFAVHHDVLNVGAVWTNPVLLSWYEHRCMELLMFAIQIFIVFFVFVSNNYFIILIVLYCMIMHTYR